MLIFYWLILLATTLILLFITTKVFKETLTSYWDFWDMIIIPIGILLTIGNTLNCIATFPFTIISP